MECGKKPIICPLTMTSIANWMLLSRYVWPLPEGNLSEQSKTGDKKGVFTKRETHEDAVTHTRHHSGNRIEHFQGFPFWGGEVRWNIGLSESVNSYRCRASRVHRRKQPRPPP
jgi:hypothetical protein